jgi:hypothetical protein
VPGSLTPPPAGKASPSATDDRQLPIDRIPGLIARFALSDPRALSCISPPDSPMLAVLLRERGVETRNAFFALAGNLERDYSTFVPDAFWVAWLQTVHRDRLERVATDLMRLPTASAPPGPIVRREPSVHPTPPASIADDSPDPRPDDHLPSALESPEREGPLRESSEAPVPPRESRIRKPRKK